MFQIKLFFRDLKILDLTDTSLSWPQKASRIFARLFSRAIIKNQVVLKFRLPQIDIDNKLNLNTQQKFKLIISFKFYQDKEVQYLLYLKRHKYFFIMP